MQAYSHLGVRRIGNADSTPVGDVYGIVIFRQEESEAHVGVHIGRPQRRDSAYTITGTNNAFPVCGGPCPVGVAIVTFVCVGEPFAWTEAGLYRCILFLLRTRTRSCSQRVEAVMQT